MAKSMKQDKAITTVAKAQEQNPVETAELAETVTADGGETKTAVKPAYRNYLEARKGLAEAFRGRSLRDQEACKDAERRYQLCEEAIEKAMKVREKAELDALEAYREELNKAVEKASQEYKGRMKQALIECKQHVLEAWKSSMENSTRMKGIFEEERNIKKEEQSGEPKTEHKNSQIQGAIQRLNKGLQSIVQRTANLFEVKRSTQ